MKIIIYMMITHVMSVSFVFSQQLENLSPQPRCAYLREELSAVFDIHGIDRILFDDKRNEDIANRLRDELITGGYVESLKIEPLTEFTEYQGAIVIGVSSSIANRIINQMESEQSIEINLDYPGSEGYGLDISPSRCVINGSDRSGLFYGIQTLLQMLENSENSSLRACRIIDAPQYPVRWFYYPINFLVGANTVKAKEIWSQAYKNKLNGAYVTDYKFEFISTMPQRYIDSLKSLREYTSNNFMQFVAGCMPFGYSNSIMYHNPNLAAGLPVEGQKFIIEGDTARLIPSADVELSNPGFEIHNGDNFSGFTYIDRPGEISFADKQIFHSGTTSIRFSDFNNAAGLNARVTKRVAVKKNKEFYASAFVKSENLKMSYRFQIIAIGNTGRTLCYQSLNLPATSDWTKYDVSFNSLDNDTITVYWGVWGPQEGEFWMDDLVIEETAFMNLIRRSGAPLNVSHQFLDLAYEEGVDYDSLIDRKMGRVYGYGGDYDYWHQPPTFKIKQGGNIHNGDTLIISYFHTTVIYDSQVMASTTEPGVYEILENELNILDSVAKPDQYFMNHDEIRVMNWDAGDKSQNKTLRQLLADNVTLCINIIRNINADAKIWDWSDMFDEYHNANSSSKNYYLVNGNFGGVGNDLQKDIGIVNWNNGSDKSMEQFASLGFSQITAPFYDTDENHIRQSKEKAKDIANFKGMMYTTWQKNYNYLLQHGWYSWNHAPFIYHQPPQIDKREIFNIEFTIAGDRWDKDWDIDDVKIYFRYSNIDDFIAQDVTYIDGRYSYQLNIPNDASMLQYYIAASDTRGWLTKVPFGAEKYYEYIWTDISEEIAQCDFEYNQFSKVLHLYNCKENVQKIYIYDLLGNTIFESQLLGELAIDFVDKENGVYFLKIISGKKVTVHKFINY